MLIRLFGENFRSLKAPFELSMVAADLRRKEDANRGLVEVPIKGMDEPLRLLRTVAIYGPNASGKSTVLSAANALRWLAVSSSAQSQPGFGIPPYEPFSLDEASRTATVELGCDVTHGSSVLRYETKFRANEILEETLSLLDEHSEVVLIDRLPSGEVAGRLIEQGEANRLYVKEMQPNVTVLSKLAQHGPSKGKESVQSYYQAIRNALTYLEYSNAAGQRFNLGRPEDERFADDVDYREWIMRHLIRNADVGISDVRAHREPVEFPPEIREMFEKTSGSTALPDKRVVISFLHEGASSQFIDFSRESAGTRKLFFIAGDWWRLANQPLTILADELGASLHPRLLDQLIRAVNDLPSSVESQLVFATHDTGLLEGHDGKPPALRRDQVYFTRKDIRGESELYSLAEFKEDARAVHNIRKRYMSGRYGALPAVENLSL